jgi:hypothetical protein
MASCLQCGGKPERAMYRYCSNRCQMDHQYNAFISKWKKGEIDGGIGKEARNISGHVKRYLLTMFGERCNLCGWDRINPKTGRVPLEIDHIDGNSENNSEGNLRLICPNCHSLTPGFRNLNRGSGRRWRRNKYLRHADYATLAQW